MLEVVNFLVLVWMLKRFLYKPVLEAIAQRKAAIDKTLSDAASATGRRESARTSNIRTAWPIGRRRRKLSRRELAGEIQAAARAPDRGAAATFAQTGA